MNRKPKTKNYDSRTNNNNKFIVITIDIYSAVLFCFVLGAGLENKVGVYINKNSFLKR